MGALYVVLGLFFGVAITEAIHWRTGDARIRRRNTLEGVRRRPTTAQSSSAASSTGRFTAQDYYDR